MVPVAIMLLSVLLGAVIQGSIGFGFALLVVPVLTALQPQSVPATVLLLGVPLTCAVAIRERVWVDSAGLPWVIPGQLLGTLGGIGLLTVVPTSRLSILIGSIILVATLISTLGFRPVARGGTRLAGGLASGVMGTAAGVGGPPLALVYQERPGRELRPTLSLAFALGAVMSLSGIAFINRLGIDQLGLALQLLPAMLIGLWASRWVSRFLDEGWLRGAVLVFAAASGLAVVFTGISS